MGNAVETAAHVAAHLGIKKEAAPVAILGAQWGDEGKGKVVDGFHAPVVVRFNGGANAGHTIINKGNKVVVHLLPSGILSPDTQNMVGPYVVCDPLRLAEELSLAKEYGSQVIIDASAPVVLPHHRAIEEGRERRSGAQALGTTKQGIGPCYEDFASRRGATIGDYADPNRLAAFLDSPFYHERLAVIAHLGGTLPRNQDVMLQAAELRKSIAPHLGDVRHELAQCMAAGKKIVAEAAQGVLLDVIHGQRPYCTSSFSTIGGISASLGVHRFSRVIGVAKGYVTRVGAGPFPTELHDAIGEDLRQRGQEFGATTGRPRRCGWLDIPALRYAIRMGGITEIVLNKMDILEAVPEILVCIAYELNGKQLTTETLTADVLNRVKPIYARLPGWHGEKVPRIAECTHWAELPLELTGPNVEMIEQWLGIPVTGIGVNAERVVWRKE